MCAPKNRTIQCILIILRMSSECYRAEAAIAWSTRQMQVRLGMRAKAATEWTAEVEFDVIARARARVCVCVCAPKSVHAYVLLA